MDLTINTNQDRNSQQQSPEKASYAQDRPAYTDIQKFSSRGRFYQLNFDAYYLEYRSKGLFRWFSQQLGFNTQLQLPPNVIVKSRLKYGFWLTLTIQNYSVRAGEIKIRQLTPVFLPGFGLARKSQKIITSIVNRNRGLANPEMYFVMPGQSEKIAKDAPLEKTESRVGHIDLMGYRGKEMA